MQAVQVLPAQETLGRVDAKAEANRLLVAAPKNRLPAGVTRLLAAATTP